MLFYRYTFCQSQETAASENLSSNGILIEIEYSSNEYSTIIKKPRKKQAMFLRGFLSILYFIPHLFFIHNLHIFLVGDISATHRLEMRSLQLAINHLATIFLQESSQKDEGKLGG